MKSSAFCRNDLRGFSAPGFWVGLGVVVSEFLVVIVVAVVVAAGLSLAIDGSGVGLGVWVNLKVIISDSSLLGVNFLSSALKAIRDGVRSTVGWPDASCSLTTSARGASGMIEVFDCSVWGALGLVEAWAGVEVEVEVEFDELTSVVPFLSELATVVVSMLSLGSSDTFRLKKSPSGCSALFLSC